ncbi:MAG: hypothetical protein KZQ83_07915 [gamma proteobacterium symbiont of Taylorina sp.]|nr:hypothetical protein [gamma proteobacterium symbiont of Taylorina sp.]
MISLIKPNPPSIPLLKKGRSESLQKNIYFQIILFILCCFSSQSYAAVDLFDSNRGKTDKVGKKKPVKPKPKARQKTLDLMFVGISRTGSTRLYFKDKKNKQVMVSFDAQKQTALPGYDDLIIEKIENRSLFVKDAKNKYCIDDEKKGLYCLSDQKLIEMRLVRKYVAASRTVPKSAKNKAGIVRIDPKDVPEGQRLIKTPFGDRLAPKK